ncbi:MAG TPA: hypothetical protein VMY37_01590 [Thermoguttaceae bacterium]|nr:hypothetical protein [Thermoguttaceae bacterium]
MLGIAGFRRDEPRAITRRALTITEPVTLDIAVVATSATRKTVTISTSALGHFVLYVWAAPATGALQDSVSLLNTPVLPAYRVTDQTGVLSFDLHEDQAGAWRICAVVVNRAARDDLAWEGLVAAPRPADPAGTVVIYGGFMWTRRFAGTVELTAGTLSTVVDLSACGLTSTGYTVQVSMQVPTVGGVLLDPVVTAKTQTTMTVDWGSVVPGAGYILHWNITT